MFSGGPSWHRKSSSLSKGSIAGIVVGAIAGLVLIIGGLVFFLRKRKARQNNQNLVNIEENAQAPQMTHIVAAQHNHVVAEVDDGHAEKKVEVLPPYTGPRAGEYAVEAPTKEKKSFKN